MPMFSGSKFITKSLVTNNYVSSKKITSFNCRNADGTTVITEDYNYCKLLFNSTHISRLTLIFRKAICDQQCRFRPKRLTIVVRKNVSAKDHTSDNYVCLFT